MNFMRMMISNGGGYSGGMGMSSSDGGEGIAGGAMGFLSTLPSWLSTIIMIVGVVICALIIGWIAGKVIGKILYPDPDKESIFNLKQRIAIFLVLVITIGGTGYTIYREANPKQNSDIMVNGGEMLPEKNGDMTDGVDATLNPDDSIATDSPEGDSSTTDGTESSSESSSESLAADTPVVNAPIADMPMVTPKI